MAINESHTFFFYDNFHTLVGMENFLFSGGGMLCMRVFWWQLAKYTLLKSCERQLKILCKMDMENNNVTSQDDRNVS